MSNYKGAVVRLSILCVLLIAMLSLIPPVQALTCDSACLACKHQCFIDNQHCVGAGCDEILVDCLDGCMGL